MDEPVDRFEAELADDEKEEEDEEVNELNILSSGRVNELPRLVVLKSPAAVEEAKSSFFFDPFDFEYRNDLELVRRLNALVLIGRSFECDEEEEEENG